MNLIRTTNSFKSITVDSSSLVFCDTETTIDEGLTDGGLYGKIRLFQIYQHNWPEAILIDCFFIPLQDVLKLLQQCSLVFHNASYDLHTINLKTKKVWIPAQIHDTLYLSRLKYFTKIKFGFYDCLDYAGLSDSFIQSIDKKKEQQSDWSGPLSIEQKEYAAADATYLAKLFDEVSDFTESTIYSLDIDNLKLALQYSRHGMPINQKTVSTLKKKYYNKLEKLLEDLPLNPRSSKQSCEYLGTSSSDAQTLLTLILEGNVRAKKIKDARHYFKSLEYLNAYDRPVVKGFFQPCAAIAGRFSCTGGNRFDHANLQQMPEHLHSVVEAPKNYSIVYSDYSGLELRMAAAYTGEATMSQMMIAGQDLHTETAKYIFSKKEVSDEERTVAKTFNFTLIYGGGIRTVRQTLKLDAGVEMSYQEVKERVNMWFDMFHYFREWHNMNKRQFAIYGFVDIVTALGRKVRTYRLTDSLNFPIQGSSVEVTKVSLGLLHSRHPDAYLINTIHDSNILLALKKDEKLWGNRLAECMTDAWDYVIQDLVEPTIPMPKGYEIGPIWTFH